VFFYFKYLCYKNNFFSWCISLVSCVVLGQVIFINEEICDAHNAALFIFGSSWLERHCRVEEAL